MWLPSRPGMRQCNMGDFMKQCKEQPKGPSKLKLYLMMAALGLAYFFSNFHRLSLGVLGNVMAEDFGLSSAQLGMLGSAFFYAYAAMQVPSGVLSDQVGAKYLIAGSCLVSGLGTLWFGMAGNVTGLAMARALTGLAVAFVYVPALASIRYWFGDSNLGTMTGILVAMGQMGAVCASAPLKLVADSVGWRSTFRLIGIISVVLCVLAFFTVLNADQKKHAVKAAKGSWKTAFRPAAFSIAIWFFITGGARLSFQSLWGNQFFLSYWENTPELASQNLMWISVGCIVGAIVLGRVSDRFGSIQTLVVSSLVMAVTWVCFLALGPDSSKVLMAVVSISLGFLGAGSFTVGFACVREFADSNNTGLLTGVNNCVCFLGSAIFTQMSGSFVDLFQDASGKRGFVFLLAGFGILSVAVTGIVAGLNRGKLITKTKK